MTQLVQLPPAPDRQFKLVTQIAPANGTPYDYDQDLSPQEAQEALEDALRSGTLLVSEILPFVGALALHQPGKLLLDTRYPRAHCDCCNDKVEEFLVVS
jgi:hypothetical protein